MKPITPEQKSALTADLEEERQWLIAEIADHEATIRHYRRSLASVEEEVTALAGKGGAE